MISQERAAEVLMMHKECQKRKKDCRWFCEICEFGQYARDEYLEALEHERVERLDR